MYKPIMIKRLFPMATFKRSKCGKDYSGAAMRTLSDLGTIIINMPMWGVHISMKLPDSFCTKKKNKGLKHNDTGDFNSR